jgi:hypothetical protein
LGLLHLLILKMTAFWDTASWSLAEIDRRFRGAIIALLMEVVRNSETSANFYDTIRRDMPVGSQLHTRRRRNLKPLLCFTYILEYKIPTSFLR